MSEGMHSIYPLRWLGATHRNKLSECFAEAWKSVVRAWSCQSGAESGKFQWRLVDDLGSLPSVGTCYEVVSVADKLLMNILVQPDALRQSLGLPQDVFPAWGEGLTLLLSDLEQDFFASFARQVLPQDQRAGVSLFRSRRKRLEASKLPGAVHAMELISERGTALAHVVFETSLVNELIPHNTHAALPIASRRSAIGTESCSVMAFVGQASLTLGALRRLEVGDVLVLDSVLSDQVRILTDKEKLVATGALVRIDQRVAILLDQVSDNSSELYFEKVSGSAG